MIVATANTIKRAVFSVYLLYFHRFPLPLGKGFLTRVVRRFGLARYRIDGAVFELNPCAWIDRLLISGETHDPFVRQIMAERLRDGGVFVDIGANIGVFTLVAARVPGVFVYAFEPSPRELKRLYKNLAANDITNVVVSPIALGRKSESLNLSLGGDLNPGTNSFVPASNGEHALETALCRCEPFDTLFPVGMIPQIRVVKMDVEGYEMSVLQGMTAAIEHMTRVVFLVEVTRSFLQRAGSSAEELYSFFQTRGFTPKNGIQGCDQWDEAFSK